jgi:hypothetical protein
LENLTGILHNIFFEVYYNSGGKSLAQYVLTNAKKQLNEVEKILDYKLLPE